MLYSTDGETWSEEIPAGTEAGAYTVYYKAAGAEGYEDSEAGSVSVTISAQEQPEETEGQGQEAEAGELPGETEGQEQEAEAGEQPAVLESAGAGDAPSGSCGDGVVWELDSTGTTLIVSYTGSGTGKMQDYNPIEPPWYYYENSITSVSIGSGVTSIGIYSFFALLNLSDVLIPGSVETIGENAFRGCTSLSSVTLSEGVKSIEDR